MLTERSLRTYNNFGIEVSCRRCGKRFRAGDIVIKTRPRAGSDVNPFYCPEHFYSESARISRRQRITKIVKTLPCKKLLRRYRFRRRLQKGPPN